MSYMDWGGSASPPQIAIVDWEEVPTWSEFEILQSRFEKMGVPTVIADPRELEFDGQRLVTHDKKIDLVYRRILINDIVAKPAECAALVKAYTANAVCVANTFPLQNSPRESLFRRPHRRTKWRALFPRRARTHSPPHSLDARRGRRKDRSLWPDRSSSSPSSSKERENLVLKPSDEYGGSGVTLGWETDEAAWDAAIGRALSAKNGAWIVQERIPIRREVFPYIAEVGKVDYRDMLVDFAPYLFRGKVAGFLTRLSATGLANVTSGGGQVPAFRVSPRTANA